MRAAAFTMVRDETVFLDIWLSYYTAQLEPQSVFVIDHGSASPVRAPRGVTVVRLPRDPLDEVTRCKLVGDFNAFLLSTFDTTVFSDADEIVAPDPGRYSGLRDYLAATPGELIAGIGLALVHRRAEEAPFDPTQPILAQRGYVHFHGNYCKPLVSRTPVQWRHGFHGAKQPFETDPNLFVFHLKAMDYDLAHLMLDVRRGGPQSARMVEKQHSVQFRMDDAEFDAIYFGTTEEEFASALEDFALADEIARFRAQAEPDPGYGSLRRLPDQLKRLF